MARRARGVIIRHEGQAYILYSESPMSRWHKAQHHPHKACTYISEYESPGKQMDKR
jgi:hypothetical protein